MDNEKALRTLMYKSQILTNERPAQNVNYLVKECLLSEHFGSLVPFIDNVTSFNVWGILTQEIHLKYEKYHNDLRFWLHRESENPWLFTGLTYYPEHFEAFKYVLNNWTKFYKNIDAIMLDLIICYISPYSLNVPLREEVIEVIHEFFKNNKIIKHINKYQSRMGLRFRHCKELGDIVYELDTDRKYEIINPALFMKLHIHRPDFNEFYEKYERNFKFMSRTSDWDDLLLELIENGYYEKYKFLVNRGYKISRLSAYWGYEVIGSTPEILELVEDLFPINDLFQTIIEMVQGYYVIKNPKNLIRVIEYNSKFVSLDFNKLLSEIRPHTIANTKEKGNLILSAMWDNKSNSIHYASKLKTYLTYDIDMLFRDTNISEVKTWKFNFTSMLRFHKNI